MSQEALGPDSQNPTISDGDVTRTRYATKYFAGVLPYDADTILRTQLDLECQHQPDQTPSPQTPSAPQE